MCLFCRVTAFTLCNPIGPKCTNDRSGTVAPYIVRLPPPFPRPTAEKKKLCHYPGATITTTTPPPRRIASTRHSSCRLKNAHGYITVRFHFFPSYNSSEQPENRGRTPSHSRCCNLPAIGVHRHWKSALPTETLTCPSDAAARGSGVMSVNTSSTGRPYSSSMVCV